MTETDVDIAQGATGSYNFSAYEKDDWPRIDIRQPQYSDSYPAGLLGPECLLESVEAGSPYLYLHSRGPYDQWRADQEHKAP